VKITFPHIGRSSIAFAAAAESIGLEYVIPPRAYKEDLSYGGKVSPETICLPFKVNMGNLMKALDAGADTITMAGGIGPCRFGYYAKGLETILKDLGYNFTMLNLNQRDLPQIYRTLKKFSPKRFFFLSFMRGFFIFWQKAKALAEAEALKRKWLPFALRRSEVNTVFKESLNRIEDAKGFFDVLRARKQNKTAFQKILKDMTRNPLKIGLVGEIYMVIDPQVNMDLENIVGEMGAETHTVLSLYKWLKYIFNLDHFGKRSFKNLVKTAKPYLSENAGGESQNNIGGTILYAKEGFDGVIHIYPFTCMPGLVGHTILNKVSVDHNIPVLNLCIDEHSSETGLKTRLEAFIDMLEARRIAKNALLSGN
jgi:predicted nucleotide-binding protein (sugar kinase/HSP70/actin superfamily)